MSEFKVGDKVIRKDSTWSSYLCTRSPNGYISLDEVVTIVETRKADNYDYQNLKVKDKNGNYYGYVSYNCVKVNNYIEEDEYQNYERRTNRRDS